MCDEPELNTTSPERAPRVSSEELARALCTVARRPLPAQADVEQVERYTVSELRLRVCFDHSQTHRVCTSALGSGWQEHLGSFEELLSRSRARWVRPFDPAPEIREIARELIDREECHQGRRARSVELHVRTEELVFVRFTTPREHELRCMATYPPRLVWSSRRTRPWYQQVLGLRTRPDAPSSAGPLVGEE